MTEKKPSNPIYSFSNESKIVEENSKVDATKNLEQINGEIME